MFRDQLREGVQQVGVALRDPEEFAAAWNDGRSAYPLAVWAALLATAIVGTTTYGMTMGLLGGADDIFYKAVICTLAAGFAWAIPLPALYIINSLAGSKLRPSTTLLAALVTTSWGGLAMIASVPINWFFSTAVPDLPIVSPFWAAQLVRGVNLLIFAGVGTAMIDVFRRVMQRLEPTNAHQPLWYLALVGVIGAQLFYLFGLFEI